MANGGEGTTTITGSGGAATGIATLQGFGVGFGAIAGGLGIGALNPVTSALMPSIGDGSAGFTERVAAPTAAPKGGMGGRDTPAGASVNNRGGLTELAAPDLGVPDALRGNKGAVACDPACAPDPDAAFGPNKSAADAYKEAYWLVGNGMLLADGLRSFCALARGGLAALAARVSALRALGLGRAAVRAFIGGETVAFETPGIVGFARLQGSGSRQVFSVSIVPEVAFDCSRGSARKPQPWHGPLGQKNSNSSERNSQTLRCVKCCCARDFLRAQWKRPPLSAVDQ